MDQLTKSNNSIFDMAQKISDFEEKQKELIEFILWIKEAFGHCINEDYFSSTLGEHIDFSLKEFEIENITEIVLKFNHSRNPAL